MWIDRRLQSCRNGQSVEAKLVTVASGAASGQLIEYEKGGPGVSVQTAYGIEVEVRLRKDCDTRCGSRREFWEASEELGSRDRRLLSATANLSSPLRPPDGMSKRKKSNCIEVFASDIFCLQDQKFVWIG